MSNPEVPGARRTFGPTTGLVTGWLGLLIVAAVVVLTLLEDRSLTGVRIVLGALVCGVVLWCYLLRPRVVLDQDRLELRNAFSTTVIPWLRVGEVLVRTVTRVYVGEKVYVGTAVGHSARSLMRMARKERKTLLAEPAESNRAVDQPLPALIEEAIRERADRAHELAAPDARRGQVERRWAVPELAALGVLLVAFAASFAL
ncbi:MAG TPA: hypothetical protein VFL69_02865 [Marmoricola sp.]|nr:hypothetical protein [Marmoricola sp.]